jgi:hypothetical protein
MNIETTTDLILLYLQNHRTKVCGRIGVADHRQIIPYRSIKFDYMGYDVEVRIYNPSYINVRVNDFPCEVCDSVSALRSAIDKLHSFRF